MKIGPLEIMLIVGAIILLFGVGKIADVGKGLGMSIRQFKDEIHKKQEDEG